MASQAFYFPPHLSRRVWAFAERFNLSTLPPHASQILAAFAAYETTFFIISPVVSRLVARSKYTSLPKRTQINWNLKLVSFVQACFINYCALRVIFRDSGRRALMGRDDRLWGYRSDYGTVQAFAAGYFLWDVYVSLRYLDMLGPSSLAHGVAALAISILGFRPFANFYGVNFVLYELSTPFLDIHWWLDKLGMTGSNLQLVNGIALMGSFFGCRIAWGGWQTWLLSNDILSAWKEYRQGGCFAPKVTLENGVLQAPTLTTTISGECKYEFPTTLLFVYLVGNTMLSVLNTYWFGLMVKALRKRFQKPEPEQQKKDD